LHEAYTALVLTYGGNKTPDQRRRIRYSANRIKKEYDRVKRRTPSKTYADVARNLQSAAGRLKRIRKDRIKMANSMIEPTRILNSITGVLKLINIP
ncbi:MAG: hypothetical protein QNJ29_06165, partial [Rhizobiaceae bacterium]|nr:hypothetical protein [Rhizobiaceae bacterium]